MAAAALLIDYVLTVAVSISAGVAAIVSLPSLQSLASDRVTLCLIAITAITVANLPGDEAVGRVVRGAHLHLYALMVTLVGYGLCRTYLGHIHPIPFDPKAFEGARQMGGTLEPQRIGDGAGDQRFRQSMSFAVSKKATARANWASR